MKNKKKISINHTVLDSDEGNRVDQLVARKFPEYSRAHIQKWIKEGDLLVNGKKVKARQKVNSKDIIIVCLLYTSPSPRDRQKSRMPSSA